MSGLNSETPFCRAPGGVPGGERFMREELSMRKEQEVHVMQVESEIHEECGVFGVIAPEPCDVAGISYQIPHNHR